MQKLVVVIERLTKTRDNPVTWRRRLHDSVTLIGVVFLKEARRIVPSRKNGL